MKGLTNAAFYSLIEASTENILNMWSIRLDKPLKFDVFFTCNPENQFSKHIPEETKSIYYMSIKEYGVHALFSYENIEKYEALEWSEILLKAFLSNISSLFENKKAILSKLFIKENFQGIFDSILPEIISSENHFQGIGFTARDIIGFIILPAPKDIENE